MKTFPLSTERQAVTVFNNALLAALARAEASLENKRARIERYRLEGYKRLLADLKRINNN